MKSKSVFRLCYRSVIVMFIAFTGCKKNAPDVLTPELSQHAFSVGDARSWYASSFKNKNQLSNARTDAAKKLGDFTPDWDKAVNTEDDKFYVIQLPIQFAGTVGYSFQAGTNASPAPGNSATRLLILKDKKTGNISSALMHVYSSGTIAEKIIYGKKDESFNGIIFFSDNDGNFYNGWKYENGTVTGKIRQRTGNSTGYRTASGDLGGTIECLAYVVNVYYRDCTYDKFGTPIACTEWQLMNSYLVDNCPEGGSSGGTVEPPAPECGMSLDEAEKTLNAISGSSTANWVNYSSGGATVGADGVIRESVNIHFPVFTLKFINYYISYTGHGTAIRYRKSINERWKFEPGAFGKTWTVDANDIYPACWSDKMVINVTEPIISADGEMASFSVYYNLTISLFCLGGQTFRIFKGTHPVNVYANDL